ncbi:MAG: transcriptional regulator [Saccharolobus sp.]|uniref:transcriptional regulator n=1 Tax=Saccharolobus TaxID=2100760 RepID=UPI001F0CE82D|nr:transcriptional regulator [Saccharolobus shibatae]MCH4815062.1 transcriptional regulator [Saccharolobus shibatae]
MSLQLPCEFSVREILPAVRSIVAQKLIKERNLSEYKAANLMGLTPAAVSNYLKSRRGSNLRSLLEKDEKFMDLVNEVMERILNSNSNLSVYYCILCSEGKKVLTKHGYTLGPCLYEATVEPK